MSAADGKADIEEKLHQDDAGEENEDPTVCDICLDGEVYDNNEILFCDSCDVAVHQLCYGVKKIPAGSWFCYVCAKGMKPSEVTCELCSFKGGAYKPVDKKGKWTHGLCPVWIPELYEQHSQSEPPTWQLQHLDKRRYNLKCALCKTKGACVQCSYGRCTTAVHPWCALRTPQGFTRRIIKDEDDEPHWEIFCKPHAKAVSDPVKKSSKNKNQSHSSAALFEENDIYWEDSETKASHPQGRRQSEPTAAAANVVKTPAVMLNLVEDVGDVHNFPLKDDQDDDDQNDSDDEKPSGLAGALQEQSATSFPTLSLLEWPGLSEGDGMDLDHFWNFTSSFFAEDHTREWYKYMKQGAMKALPRNEEEAVILQFSTALKSASKEDLEDLLEEINDSFSSERNRSSALYYDKRNRFLDEVERTLEILVACASDNTNPLSAQQQAVDNSNNNSSNNNADKEKEAAIIANSNALAAAKSKLFAYYQHKRFSYDDELAFLPTDEATPKAQFQSTMVDQESDILKVVFDGSTRIGASFAISKGSSDCSNIAGTEEDAAAARQYLYPVQNHNTSSARSDLPDQSLTLQNFELIPYDQKLLINNKTILAKDDIPILQRLILTDYHAYTELVQNIRGRLEKAIQDVDNNVEVGKEVSLYESSKDVHMAYVKQQVWKWICSSMHNGVCDQKPGAYKAEEEALPASWTIQVPGRPAAPTKEDLEKDAEKDAHEDIVCMCCFDGSFAEDHNQILFCDGCNATVHQKCYGIAEIPEGHFYCDRCLFIQRQYHDEDVDETFLKNAVRCCLCPLYHGGLKKTTDKRWVHMCCALFATGHTTIHNLTKMTHIDISQVPLQNQGRPLVVPKATSSSRIAVHNDACVYCHAYGGYVVTCQHSETIASGEDGAEEKKETCQVKFHPICAWFAGSYIRSEIVDPSFQGKDRHGQYPSGLSFNYLCAQHDHTVRQANNKSSNNNSQISADAIRAEQITIRSKYRINELDLTVMPGKNSKRKHRRSNNTKKDRNNNANGAGGNARGAAAASQVQKELAPDHYTDKLCAICMKPTTDDLFGSGYDSKVMSEISIDFDPANPTNTSHDTDTGNSDIKAENEEATEEGKEEEKEERVNLENRGPMTPSKASVSAAASFTPNNNVTNNTTTTTTSSHSKTATPSHHSKPVSATSIPALQQIVSCHQCGIVVHEHCLRDFAPATAESIATNTLTASSTNAQGEATSTDNDNSAATAKKPWFCTLCATNSDVLTMDCALCPRHGGIFCPTIENTMVHPYCARIISTQVIAGGNPFSNVNAEEKEKELGPAETANTTSTSSSSNNNTSTSEDMLELKQYVKDATRKQKCGICNRKKGWCLPCSEVGCPVFFHPLCGLRSGKGFVRMVPKTSHSGHTVIMREAFCQDHIPTGIEMSSTGFWIDGCELGHMRRSMDQARIIFDVLIKREKFKKLIAKTELDLFNLRFQKAFARTCGKKLNVNALDEREQMDRLLMLDDGSEYDYDNDDDEYNLDDDKFDDENDANHALHDEIFTQFQKKHGESFVLLTEFPQMAGKESFQTLPFTHPKTQEILHISPTWTKYGEIRRPKNMRISFAGHQLFPRDIVALSQKAFVRMQVEKIHRQTDETRALTGTFANRKAEETFGKKLLAELYPQSQMSDKDFIEFMKNEAPESVALPRVGVNRRSTAHTTNTANATSTSNSGSTAKQRKSSGQYAVEESAEEEEEEEEMHVKMSGKNSKKRVSSSLFADEKGTTSKTSRNNNSNSKKRKHAADEESEAEDEEELLIDSDDDDYPRSTKKNKNNTNNNNSNKKIRLSLTAEDDQKPVSEEKHNKKLSFKLPMFSTQSLVVQQQLQEIRTSPAYQEYVKHFYTTTSAATNNNNNSTNGNSRRRSGSSGSGNHGPVFFTTIYETAFPPPNNATTSTNTTTTTTTSANSGEAMMAIPSLFQVIAPASPLFITLERIIFHVLDDLSEIEDQHPETLALIAEEAQLRQQQLARNHSTNKKNATKHGGKKNGKKNGGASNKGAKKSGSSSSKKTSSRDVDKEEAEEDQEDEEVEEEGEELDRHMLLDEYEDIPYEALPQYDDFVRRAVSINGMKQRLQAHGYRSLASFVQDFMTLMNNARHVATMANSKIRDNTKRLTDLFEHSLFTALHCHHHIQIHNNNKNNNNNNCYWPRRYQPAHQGHVLTQTLLLSANHHSSVVNSNSNSGDTMCVSICCSHCNQLWSVSNWPAAFTIPAHLQSTTTTTTINATSTQTALDSESNTNKRRRMSSSSSTSAASATATATREAWFCHECIVSQGEHILYNNNNNNNNASRVVSGRVQVWWRDDGVAYVGHIQAYEALAQCHRVWYPDDDEWEFVHLGLEPYLFCA